MTFTYFGQKNVKLNEPWTPVYHLSDAGYKICQHGVDIEIHCCNCHNGVLFNPEYCVCVQLP
jgi:hypothetical protein